MSNLSDKQRQSLQLFEFNMENLFISGVAGSGKSYLLNLLREKVDKKTFPSLASTGSAAILVGGQTFHSFMGLGIFEGGKDKVIERALKDKKLKNRLNKIEGFFLDEVSMISADVLDAAEAICSYHRGNTLEPWGGLRVVMMGDFAQLPPVNRSWNKDKNWAFQSLAWKRSHLNTVLLDKSYRSNNDYLDVLSLVRHGEINDKVKDFLNTKVSGFDQDFDGTTLLPTRKQNEVFNQRRLDQIAGDKIVIPTEYYGEQKVINSLRKNMPISDVLEVKVGALVMCRRNDPKKRWVNGSLGKIVGIEDEALYIELMNGRYVEIEKESFSLLNAEGEVLASAINFPVNLAYSTTIHKAQGMTIDRLQTSLGNLWEPGQAYVALSRVRSADDIRLIDWSMKSFIVDKKVEKFYQEFI